VLFGAASAARVIDSGMTSIHSTGRVPTAENRLPCRDVRAAM
jgi:hypothetical protein